MAATTAEYTLTLTEEEHTELLGILEWELADVHSECRRPDAPQQLRDEETVLRRLTAKVRALASRSA